MLRERTRLGEKENRFERRVRRLEGGSQVALRDRSRLRQRKERSEYEGRLFLEVVPSEVAVYRKKEINSEFVMSGDEPERLLLLANDD